MTSMATKNAALLTIAILFALPTAFAPVHAEPTADLTAPQQPAWIIELPANVNTVLVADASEATLHRFVARGQHLQWLDARYMSIGQNGVRKERAWDKKTPLGAYFITDRLNTVGLHEKYGAAAFPLDYPNAWDRHNARTGNGIWLHGVDRRNPNRPPLDTDGCLALKNDALLELADDLVPMTTPVLVANSMQWRSANDIETTRLEFRIALDEWRTSVLQGDLMSYLTLYSDEFRHLDMGKADWAMWRMQVFDGRSVQRFDIDNLMLLADPAEENLFLSRFTQTLVTETDSITTTKRLYWRRQDGNRWRILSEDAG